MDRVDELDTFIVTWKGKPLKSLTDEELITALNEQAEYYESRLADKDKIIALYKNKG